MQFEIIDFHTHPFMDAASNICRFQEKGMEDAVSYLRGLGVSKICGSVIAGKIADATPWEQIQESNRMALELQEKYAGFYVPGFHVHPAYVEQSVAEIERMHHLGVHLIDSLLWIVGSPKVVSVSGVAENRIACQGEDIHLSIAESGAYSGTFDPRPYDPQEFNVEDYSAGFMRLDNGMSINPNVGAMPSHLTRLRSKPAYYHFK